MTTNLVKALGRNEPLFIGGISVRLGASPNATTDIAETTLWKDIRSGTSAEGARTVASVLLTVDQSATAVTADNTNFWTITVARRPEASGAAVTVASTTTKAAGTNGLTGQTTYSLPLSTAANLVLTAGDQITFTAVHSATPNAAFPAGVVTVDFTTP